MSFWFSSDFPVLGSSTALAVLKSWNGSSIMQSFLVGNCGRHGWKWTMWDFGGGCLVTVSSICVWLVVVVVVVVWGVGGGGGGGVCSMWKCCVVVRGDVNCCLGHFPCLALCFRSSRVWFICHPQKCGGCVIFGFFLKISANCLKVASCALLIVVMVVFGFFVLRACIRSKAAYVAASWGY